MDSLIVTSRESEPGSQWILQGPEELMEWAEMGFKLAKSSVEEEFKVTRAREAMMYRDSSNPKGAQAGVMVKTRKKWRADDVVLQAGSRICHRALAGAMTRGRVGLETCPTPHYEAKGKERHRLIQEEVSRKVGS